MGDWEGYQKENSHQEITRITSRSKYRKPPSGSWQPTVPSWEKKFCSSVCLIPWRKLCETKRVMPLYKNIVQWNDSAGEEAFQNAKTRFWAEINGLPCDISLPDPDIYIDKIDWNSYIDPELLSDLDREPPVADDGEKDGKLGFLDSALSNRLIPCTGWGDAADPVMAVNNTVGLGRENCDRNAENNYVRGHSDAENRVAEGNSWELGWGDCNKHYNFSNAWDSSGWENRVTENNLWENGWGRWESNVKEVDNLESRKNSGGWRSGAGNIYINGEGGSRYASRYDDNSTLRFQGDHCQMSGGWRNGNRRKRTSFVYERPVINKRSLAPWQWNPIRSCGPMNRGNSTQSGNTWSWEKPVS